MKNKENYGVQSLDTREIREKKLEKLMVEE